MILDFMTYTSAAVVLVVMAVVVKLALRGKAIDSNDMGSDNDNV